MASKSLFPAGVKATADDFNDIHVNTIGASLEMQRAIAGANASPDTLLMSNTPPINFAANAFRVPAQYAAANGVFAAVAQEDITGMADSGSAAGIYFRIKWVDHGTVNRDFLDAGPPVVITPTVATVMERDVDVVIEVMEPDSTPTSDPDDIGIVKYATITTTTGTSVLTAHDPSSLLWTFPVGAAVLSHASDHTDGTDDIQIATDSQNGIAAMEDIETAQAAITAISVNAASNYLAFTTAGDNTSSPATKNTAFHFRAHSEMFVTVDEGGNDHLGLKYLGGVGLNGSANSPARSNHRHNLTTSANITVLRTIALTAANMGGVTSLTVPTSMTSILSFSMFWLPPAIASYPKVEAGSSAVSLSSSTVSVGGHASITGQQGFDVSINAAICSLSPSELAAASTAVGGTPTWTSVSGSAGSLPTSGTLYVYVSGLNEGVDIIQ